MVWLIRGRTRSARNKHAQMTKLLLEHCIHSYFFQLLNAALAYRFSLHSSSLSLFHFWFVLIMREIRLIYSPEFPSKMVHFSERALETLSTLFISSLSLALSLVVWAIDRSMSFRMIFPRFDCESSVSARIAHLATNQSDSLMLRVKWAA